MSSMPSFSSSETEGVSSLVFDATDPRDHGMVIAAEPPQFEVLCLQCFTTMERSLTNAGLLHLAMYPRWKVSGG